MEEKHEAPGAHAKDKNFSLQPFFISPKLWCTLWIHCFAWTYWFLKWQPLSLKLWSQSWPHHLHSAHQSALRM